MFRNIKTKKLVKRGGLPLEENDQGKPTAVEGVTESHVGSNNFKESVIRTQFSVELTLEHNHVRVTVG